MLKKKVLCLIVFLVCVSFISANLMIKPTQVKQNDHIQVTIYNLDRYDAYLHFYAQGFENVLHSINLGCGETCFGKRTFDYLIDSSIFEPGFYYLSVYSRNDNEWLFYEFEVVAGEITCTDSDNGKDYYIKGTAVDEHGSKTDYCYSEEGYEYILEYYCWNGESVDFDAFACPYGCENGACIEEGIVCNDGTLAGQCSTIKPKYCDNSGNLTDNCQTCGCPSNYICQVEGSCIQEFVCTDSDGGLNYYEKGEVHYGGSISYDSCNGDILNEAYCTGNVNYPKGIKSYSCPDGCDNGACIQITIPTIPIKPNTKSISKYSNKEVFLVSDIDWKNVLPFVPVAVWTEGTTINKYPFLIYYDEGGYWWSDFDADSIIYFIQQYNPSRVTIIGSTPQDLDNLLIASPDLGADLSSEQIQRIYTDNYLSYWESFDTLVYVEDNYELALLASTYASLINAPLIIQRTAYDSADTFREGINVVCVGSVSPSGSSCSENYNLEQLQQKYKTETNTDKIILVNSNDWDGSSYIFEVKASLVAPILASAKHELIISTTKTNSEEIDNYLEQKILELFKDNVKYLTIMAPSEFIPHSEDRGGVSYDWRISLDASSYADLDGDNKPDISVGRISGFTVTDISSYIARSLFYNSFTKTNNMKFMASSFAGILKNRADKISTYFSDTGYNSIPVTTAKSCYNFNPDEWKNQDLIYYADHGASYWAGINAEDMPKLSNSLAVIAACDTVKNLGSSSFGIYALKNGAIGYMGSVGTTFLSTEYTKYLNEIFYYEKTLGDAFKSVYEPTKFHGGDILLGDPTLDINPKHLLKKKIPVLLARKQCKVVGDWCCEGEICRECCSPLKCVGIPLLKECKDTRCEGTDKSCGYNEGTDSCTNCEIIPPDILFCNIWKTKVKGNYFKCNDDQLCVKKLFSEEVEDCSHYCETGKCKCDPAGTKVNLFTQGRCCNGWEWVTKTVHKWPECRLGKGSGCGRWTHDSGYKIVNDYKICK